jgi:glucosylceramidase
MKIVEAYRTSVNEHCVPLKETYPESIKESTIILGKKTGEHFQGFGGAITESAAYVLSLMTPEQRRAVLQGYYGKSGLNYHLGRLCISASDFSLSSYDYLSGEDHSLKSFSLAHEDRYLLPVLKEIEEIRGEPLTLLVSPWSPCAWMKDNHEMAHGGRLLPEYYGLWAEYECRYLEEMAKRGIHPSWISIQNEPQAVQVWESCIYSSEEEADYALVLRKALDQHGFQKTGIYIWDHNRDLLVQRANETLSRPEVNRAVEGIAFHWYVSEDFAQVKKCHEEHPDKHLLFSEGCIETVHVPEVKMGAFANGERYAKNIIGDLSGGTEGWIDWNIVLDEQGGPNHVGNYCEAPVQYDRKNHVVLFNHSYFCIEQFARFILPGAERIALSFKNPDLQGLAYGNPDQSVALVLWNSGISQNAVFEVGEKKYSLTLLTHSVSTFVLR